VLSRILFNINTKKIRNESTGKETGKTHLCALLEKN